MATAFDTTFENAVSTSGISSYSFVSNAGNVSGTVGGANRVLIGLVCASLPMLTMELVSPVTATWDSVSMSIITKTNTADGNRSLYLFGLIAPNTGNKTLATAFSTGIGNISVYLGAVNVSGADQTTGWQNGGNDTGTGTSASSVVTTANGNFAVVGHDNNNASSTAIAAGTSAWIDTRFESNAAQGYLASSGATATVTWTLGSSQGWGNVKVDVIALASGLGFPFPNDPMKTLLRRRTPKIERTWEKRNHIFVPEYKIAA